MFDLRLHEPAAYFDNNEQDYPGFVDYTCPQFVCDSCGEPLEHHSFYYCVVHRAGSYRQLCSSCLLIAEAELAEEYALAAEDALAAQDALTAKDALAAQDALTAEDAFTAEDEGHPEGLSAGSADPAPWTSLLCTVCGAEISPGEICFYEWSYLPATALSAPPPVLPAIGLTACYCEACVEECTIEPEDDLYEYSY